MQISEAESVVMEVLWRGSPRSSEEVIAELSRDQDWQVSTIKTLLGRLVKKGAVKATKDGRRFSYSPVLTRADQWVIRAAKRFGFIDRLTPAGRTLGRKEEFADLDSARRYFAGKTLFRSFDPECFDAYLQHGLEPVGDKLRVCPRHSPKLSWVILMRKDLRCSDILLRPLMNGCG